MSHPHRTRFKNDIVAECQIPHTDTPEMPVVIFAAGMPGGSSKKKLIDTWSRKGFAAILPRYRGSWESDGAFLAHEPTDDILDVVDDLTRRHRFYSILNDYSIRLTPTHIHIIGASFGGPAALLASSDTRVTSATAICPVIDWRCKSPAEPLDWLRDSTRAAFGQGYRYTDADWAKLSAGHFYNPATNTDRIDPHKCYVLYTADDEVVLPTPTATFIENTDCMARRFRRGGHMGTSAACRFFMLRRIRRHMSACSAVQKQVS